MGFRWKGHTQFPASILKGMRMVFFPSSTRIQMRWLDLRQPYWTMSWQPHAEDMRAARYQLRFLTTLWPAPEALDSLSVYLFYRHCHFSIACSLTNLTNTGFLLDTTWKISRFYKLNCIKLSCIELNWTEFTLSTLKPSPFKQEKTLLETLRKRCLNLTIYIPESN